MKIRQIYCKSCGASLDVDVKADKCTCEFCKSVFYIDKAETIRINTYIGDILITRKIIAAVLAAAVVVITGIVFLSLFFAGVFNSPEPEPAPYAYMHEKAYKYEGQYLVGEDMDAGEYVAYKDPSAEKSGQIHISLTKDAGVGSHNSVKYYTMSTNVYFTVTDGQYVTVTRANVFKVGALNVELNERGGVPGGFQVRAGTDIPVGEYAIKCLNPSSNQSMSCSYIHAGGGGSTTIYYRQILDLKEGELVRLSGAELYPLGSYPPEKSEDGGYPSGQYKVGSEIPVGEYEIASDRPDGTVTGHYKYTSGQPFITLNDVVAKGTSVYGSRNITVSLSEGDYLMLFGIKLISVGA